MTFVFFFDFSAAFDLIDYYFFLKFFLTLFYMTLHNSQLPLTQYLAVAFICYSSPFDFLLAIQFQATHRKRIQEVPIESVLPESSGSQHVILSIICHIGLCQNLMSLRFLALVSSPLTLDFNSTCWLCLHPNLFTSLYLYCSHPT